MRRASFTPAFKLSVDEPLIVVDESEELDGNGGPQHGGGRLSGGPASSSGTASKLGDPHSSSSSAGGGGAASASGGAGGGGTGSSDEENESPTNPYLLSPFRDPRETRKHSLPNIQITDGIKASQVRRLSDGGENAPTAQEAAFLAQLSQVTTTDEGGAAGASGAVGGGAAGGLRTVGGCRRHSIVTISKVPPILFGRNRRESFAAFASGGEW